MSAFPPITKWLIPSDLWQASFEEMAIDGRRGDEGVVLWLGVRANGESEVTRAVFLRGAGVVKAPALLQIDASLMNDVTDVAIDQNVVLLGQIHSHGPGYSVDLSYTDRTHGIAVPNYLSLVAPDYAMRPRTSPADCGVHVYGQGSGFVRLSREEASRRVLLVDRASQAPIVVGG